jgi:predicted dehydrogenase
VTREPVRVALVGAGYWGINLCRVLAQHPAAELLIVCDAQEAARARAARLAPQARMVASVDEALADEAVEAVVVATPVHAHHDVVMRALRSGRHVLVEKPMADTVDQAEEMCRSAEAGGLTLGVGHIFLYNSAVRRVRQMIDDGEIGDLRYIFCRRLSLGIVRPDVDVIGDLGAHDIGLLHYWVDRPLESASAFGHSFLRPGIADVAFAHLSFEGNITGHLQVSWVDPAKVRQATIVGSRRMVVFDDMGGDARLAVYDKGIDIETMDSNLGGFETYAEHQVKVRAGDVWLPRVDVPEPLGEEVTDWLDCIRGGRQPLSDGRFGLTVVRTMEALRTTMQHASVSPRIVAGRGSA